MPMKGALRMLSGGLVLLGGALILLGGINTIANLYSVCRGPCIGQTSLLGVAGAVLGAAILVIAVATIVANVDDGKRVMLSKVAVLLALLSIVNLGGFFVGWILVFVGSFGWIYGLRPERVARHAARGRRTAGRWRRRA